MIEFFSRLKKIITAYNNVVKNQIPKEMPIWIEKLILKSKIDKNFSHAVNEFITHKLIYNLNTDLKRVEVITQKTFEYLETLTNELTLKEYIKKVNKETLCRCIYFNFSAVIFTMSQLFLLSFIFSSAFYIFLFPLLSFLNFILYYKL